MRQICFAKTVYKKVTFDHEKFGSKRPIPLLVRTVIISQNTVIVACIIIGNDL